MIIEKALNHALAKGCTYCDIRRNSGEGTLVSMKSGELDRAVMSSDGSIGIRVLKDGKWGFYTFEGYEDLKLAVERTIKLANFLKGEKGKKIHLAEIPIIETDEHMSVKEDPRDRDVEDKIEILRDLNSLLEEKDHLSSIEITLSDSVVKKEYYSSEGTSIKYYKSSVLAGGNLTGKNEKGMAGYRFRKGSTGGYEFIPAEELISVSMEGAESVKRLLNASSIKSGNYTVIADPDLGGVFAHEAVGHATEADLVITGESLLKDRIGEQIGSPLVTIFDDPTLTGGFGCFPYDDEGVRTRRKTLIEKGVLMDYLTDRETASSLSMEPNGSARAQSSSSSPLVRMSNTMIGNGDHSFQELIEDIKDGVYLMGSRGGQVDTLKGIFQFNAQEGFRIEKGELTKPLKDVSLAGSTLTTLHNIDAVGNDFRFGGPGFCGKGQTVPVSDGGPHIRIKKAVVGGV